jgi:type IV secretory pathway VirJ component
MSKKIRFWSTIFLLFSLYLPGTGSEIKENNENITITQSKPKHPVLAYKAAANPTGTLVFYITGDAGYKGFDRFLAEELVAAGYSVVALDAVKYFWITKPPDIASKDASEIIYYYQNLWKTNNIIMLGYSYGAAIIPFVASRLPLDLKKKVKLVASLSPDAEAEFEFHFTSWVGMTVSKEKYDVIKEFFRIRELPVLCIFGEGDADIIKGTAASAWIKPVFLPGGHHYKHDYKKVVSLIAERSKL